MGRDEYELEYGGEMAQAEHPGIVTRMVAALRGEVNAATLEAYRGAGMRVYDVFAEVDLERKQTIGAAPVGERSRRVAVWNALVPQLLAEALLEADYAADPRTAGYLPQVTAEQARRLFALVEPWLARAQRGRVDPSFNLAAELTLPARLPAWVEAEPCPPAHLTAMIAACRRISAFADAALADAEAEGEGEGEGEGNPSPRSGLPRLRQLWAEADTAVQYADALLRPGAGADLHEAIEDKLHRAVELWYLLGQLAADPHLQERGGGGTRGTRGRLTLAAPSSLPGAPDFDPWCLTDPFSRQRWQSDRKAARAIELLWAHDPDPAATLTIQAEIDAALLSGDIASTTPRKGLSLGHYFCCPWGALYEVRRPVRIARKRLHVMEQFVFDVSAEELAEGGKFVRRIVRGPFHDTKQIDYCDPNAKGHGR